MSQSMFITNRETKKAIGEYWFGNPFTGIANFPEEMVHGPDCELLVEVENPETGLFEKPTTCTCKPILKEALFVFPHDHIWRKAVKDITLPATSDVEDDARYEYLLGQYVELLTEATSGEGETPVFTSLVIDPVTIAETKVGIIHDITIATKDQFGNAIIVEDTPVAVSLYGKCTLEIVDGIYKATMTSKGVDVIKVTVGEVSKEVVIKIRDLKPYPNVYVDSNKVNWLKLDVDEYTAYIQSGVIVNPELVDLVEEREYWWNELFVETSAWADPAIRAVATADDLVDMDAYREAVASMLNWIDEEITQLRTNTLLKSLQAKTKPAIPNVPDIAYRYKQ